MPEESLLVSLNFNIQLNLKNLSTREHDNKFRTSAPKTQNSRKRKHKNSDKELNG